MPKPATPSRVETGRDGGSCCGILPQKEATNAVVRDIRIVQEVEKVARDGARRLREVNEPVDGFRELGCSARTVPQLACDELGGGRARAHDPRQRRGQRTRAWACGIGRIENDEVRRAAERAGSRGEAADEGDVFRSFQ